MKIERIALSGFRNYDEEAVEFLLEMEAESLKNYQYLGFIRSERIDDAAQRAEACGYAAQQGLEFVDFQGSNRMLRELAAGDFREEDFLATLDEMTENAFNDQCTGANPRYPLMSEIKELYLLAYYGKPTKDAEKV